MLRRCNIISLCIFLTIILVFLPLLGGCKKQAAENPVKRQGPIPTNYDVIVVGGEPEGIAAALSAARNGLKTLLVEDDEVLGGLFTLGWLNFLDMNYGPDGELLTRGIFEEFYDEMSNAFDIEECQKYFFNLVQQEENITLRLRSEFISPLLEESRIVGVKVKEKEGSVENIKEYFAKAVIDATTDADVAAAAGVPYTVGTEDYGEDRTMAVTLVFKVKGLNWPYIFLYNNGNRFLNKLNSNWGDAGGGAAWKVAWGYGQQALNYESQDGMMRFRGPNLARQDKGEVLLNALLIFEVDALDPASREKGIERGKKELPHIIEFMKKNFPGFAKVELVDTAPQLYVRETRHIEGEYRLTIDDVLENRDHWDRIAHGSYPVDIQPAAPDDLGNIIGKPAIYSIPFRCLVPLKVDNLLVASRSASYDSLPHGSARVVPVGMAVGEAAGAAAAYSCNNDVNFRQISNSKEAVAWIQETLKKQGAYLIEYDPPRPVVMDHWAYEGVKVMRRLGLAAGGYSNDYRLEKKITHWNANYYLKKVQERAQLLDPSITVREIFFPENVTSRELLLGVGQALTGKELTLEETTEYLQEAGILTAPLQERFANLAEIPTYGELYMLMSNIYENLGEGKETHHESA